uniref:Uncharacterized protein n=1 Tax=Fagus sylvatica TaxID=28930 RepID=A0A2N9H745_FAGSY
MGCLTTDSAQTYFLKGIFVNFSQVRDEDLLLRRRPSAPSSDQLPSTAHNSLVTRLRCILISYGNQVRHLTESTPHLEQVVYSAARLDCRPLIPEEHQLAPSVGNAHLCFSPHRYKRTAWLGRDRWKFTLKRFPLVASLQRWLRMEKQVRDLTANLQELTRQNEVLNQRLLQHENEKQKKDKGKSKERGDAESRQERQQEQQQEQQHEQR